MYIGVNKEKWFRSSNITEETIYTLGHFYNIEIKTLPEVHLMSK